MISHIKGKIIFRGKNFLILEANALGYKVFVLPSLNLDKEKVELFTHLSVREDSLTLFGFINYEELELFELLISVSGIGPKTGLSVLSLADPKTIKIAIAKEDPSILTRVSGIGKKTADRIILELKNKFSVSPDDKLEEKSKEISDHSDALEALVSLGYNSFQAQKALSKISPDIKDVGEKIRMALRELGKK